MLSSLLGVRIRSQLFAVCPLEPGVNFSFRTNLVVALLASFLGQGGEVQTTDMLLDYLATWLMDPFVHNHNDGHHHHGLAKMFKLCWMKAPPLTRRRTHGCTSPAPTPNTRRSCLFESGNKNEKRIIPHLTPTFLIFMTRLIQLCKMQDTKYLLNF